MFFGTLNAGHPGGMLPLTGEDAKTLRPSRLPENLFLADATLLPESLGNPPIWGIGNPPNRRRSAHRLQPDEEERPGDVAFGLASGFLLALGQIYSKAFMSGFNEGQSLSVTAATPIWWAFILLLAIGNLGNMVALNTDSREGSGGRRHAGPSRGPLGGRDRRGRHLMSGTVLRPSPVLKIGAVAAILLGVIILSRRTGEARPPRAV